MHVQASLTLPSGFQSSTCCFSMANRTIFGVDMAFVGASNGLLGLAVLQDKLLLYVQGKDPQALQRQQQHHQTTLSISSSITAVHRATRGTSPSHRGLNASTGNRPTRRATPSTVTWMRDKPLILVGYTSGAVEWYRIAISPAKQHQLRDPSKELSYGAAVPAGAFAHQAMNRESRAQVARAMLDGEVDGIRIELVATCVLSGSGSLTSSDYFPSNGSVAVGGERGVVYLFHTDQLDAPLCQLTLTSSHCTFVYCHPFQPLVGVLSPVVWTERDGPGRSITRPLPTFVGREVEEEAVPDRGRVRSGPDGERSRRMGSSLPPGASSVLHSGANGGRGSGGTGGVAWNPAPKTSRHVWWDEAMPLSPYSEEALTGCVLTIIEYHRERPPSATQRPGILPAQAAAAVAAVSTSSSPLLETHRLVPVLQHWMEGTAPRYGTFYSFSWKFSARLELSVSNLEEGALRVLRIEQTGPSPRASATGATAHSTAEEEEEDTPCSISLQIQNSTGASSTMSVSPGGHSYYVVQDYTVRIPLHSLINVEYISAATSPLGEVEDTDNGAAEQHGLEDNRATTKGAVTTFDREVSRCRYPLSQLQSLPRPRQQPILSYIVDPRLVGLSMVSSRGIGGFNSAVGRVHLQPHEGHGGPDAYGSGDGRNRLLGRSSRVAVDRIASDGPQLKENMLAAAMLLPLGSSTGGLAGGRHHRRHDDTNTHAPTEGVSSWTRSSTGHRRRHRRKSTSMTAPSYVSQSQQSDMANAALIASQHGIDLHDRLRIGAGGVSKVVGMNAAGEVAAVPIEVKALTTWHEEGSIFVGMGSTVCAADIETIQGIERVMKKRHAAGFGLSATASLAAVRKVGGYGSDDLALLLTYIATLEGDHIVPPAGPIPSMIEFLGCDSGQLNLEPPNGWRTPPTSLISQLATALEGCACHRDARRMIILHVLRWLPASLADEMTGAVAPVNGGTGSTTDATASTDSSLNGRASQAPSELLFCSPERIPRISEASTDVEVERAVAVEVTHGRFEKGAELLLRFKHRSPSYRAIAMFLQRRKEAVSAVHDSDGSVRGSFETSLSPWLRVIYTYVCATINESASVDLASRSSTWALPRHIYQHLQLPLWDRVALAVVLETNLEVWKDVLHTALLPHCNPIQALFLQDGIHSRSYPAMQRIVDMTGDYQLGACLFARVGVISPAAPYGLPFLLDVGGSLPSDVKSNAAAPRDQDRVWVTDSATDSGAEDLSTYLFAHRGDGYLSLPEKLQQPPPQQYHQYHHDLPPPPSLSAAGFILHQGQSRTSGLLAASTLPPPPRSLPSEHPPEVAVDAGPLPSLPSKETGAPKSVSSQRCVLPDSALTPQANEEDVEVEDLNGEVPWVWWAAAYRSFLDSEQAFVRRTTFDVECQRLRGTFLHASRGGLTRDKAEDGCRAGLPPGNQFADSHARESPYAALLAPSTASTAFASQQLPTTAHRRASHSRQQRASDVSGHRDVSQQVRSLLGACRSIPTRCSLCMEVVPPNSREATAAFAWCTACQHGGHVHHLQVWFATHRKCPVDACSCHCEDTTLYR